MHLSSRHTRIIAVAGIVAVAGIALFSVVHEPGRRPAAADARVRVVTGIYPAYFLAERIGGDRVTVTNVTPAGAEPHDYEPTARQVATIEDSDVLLLMGNGIEPWGDRIAENVRGGNVNVVIVGDRLATRVVREEGETVSDPHVWLHPVRMRQMADNVLEALVETDGGHAGEYRANYRRLVDDLLSLDREFRSGLTECASRDIVTAHAAFAYLADAYNLRQVSVAGIAPSEEPSAKEMAALVAYMRERRLTYVFTERLVSPKLSATIAKEAGARTLVLDPLEGLTAEALQDGEDYLSVMRQNLANLSTALQCRK